MKKDTCEAIQRNHTDERRIKRGNNQIDSLIKDKLQKKIPVFRRMFLKDYPSTKTRNIEVVVRVGR